MLYGSLISGGDRMSAPIHRLIEQVKGFNVEDQFVIVTELSRLLLQAVNKTAVKLQDDQQQVVGYLCSPDSAPIPWDANPQWLNEMQQRSSAAQPGTGKPYDAVMQKYRELSAKATS
jgi:hypothetical protein